MDISGLDSTDVSNLTDSIMEMWSMEGFDWSGIDQLLYQGFDWETLMKVLVKRIANNKWSEEDTRGYIAAALAIHQLRGNVTAKNWSGVKAEGQDLIKKVIDAWGIVGSKKNNARMDLTFPRFGALFPFQLSIIAMRYPKDFASAYGTTALHHFFKTSSFASLIPAQQDVTQMLITAYTCFAADQGVALKGGSYEKVEREERVRKYEEQKRFTLMSFTSTVVVHKNRIRAMRFFRMELEEVYKPVRDVVDACGVTGVTVEYPVWKKNFEDMYAIIGKTPLPGRPCEPVPTIAPPPPPGPPPPPSGPGGGI